MTTSKQRTRMAKVPEGSPSVPTRQVHRSPRESNTSSITSSAPDITTDKSGPLTQQDIIHLQRSQGNQAVMRLIAQRRTASSTVQRLPGQVEGTLERMLDVDLSQVGIHTDAQADQMARASNSTATTIGSDIYFQQGAYRPGTASGNALIAREVSHIQRAKLNGGAKGSLSASDQRDAQQVSAMVEGLGDNPAEILKPASGPKGKLSKAQRSVLQRDEYSHARTTGVVASKVVQGIFTTVLGPVGLVWRYPIIQKNLGEITGWDRFGSRKGKTDDRKRYGESKLGTAMRWMAGISEVLKEFTIWLGFATFIAAIVAAATHGVAAPVFAGLAIATSVVAGVHFILRGLLVAMNGYRLWSATKRGSDTDKAKIPFIKHQMVSDGMEGIGALISSLMSGINAGGLGSIGGSLANDVGVTGVSQKLAGVGLGTLGSLPISVMTTVGKEGGKEAVKPGGKQSGWKGFKEGFFKDKTEIDNAYKDTGNFGFQAKAPQQPQPQQVPQQQEMPQTIAPVDPSIGQVLSMTGQISNKSQDNIVQQSLESGASQENAGLINDLAPKVLQTTDSISKSQTQLKETGEKSKGLDSGIPQLIDQSVGEDKGEAKNLNKQVKEGLKIEEPAIDGNKSPTSDDNNLTLQINEDDKKLDQEDGDIQLKLRRKPGVGNRIANWFAKKILGLKAGVRRLNGKILAGVLKFAGKFDKSEGDRQIAISAMSEEKDFAGKDVQEEDENDQLFGEFGDKAGELDATANMLAEMGG